jgi:hypothetical protein
MLRRTALIFVFALLPLGALADDVTPTPAPANAQQAPAPQQGSGSASLLGPQGNTSSTDDSSSLQPAGNNPLQSGSSDSTGLTSPADSALQGSAPSGDIKVLLGNESDGLSQTPGTQTNDNSVFDTLALVMLFGLFGLIWGLRYRVSRRFTT